MVIKSLPEPFASYAEVPELIISLSFWGYGFEVMAKSMYHLRLRTEFCFEVLFEEVGQVGVLIGWHFFEMWESKDDNLLSMLS